MARALCRLGLHPWRTAYSETLDGRRIPTGRVCRACLTVEYRNAYAWPRWAWWRRWWREPQ